MPYVDGFVLPLPKKNVAKYKQFAKKAGKVWMEHGALHYAECIGDDVPVGKLTSFPRSVKLKSDEVVLFSWVVYASRKDRDRVNKKVMSDPRILGMHDTMRKILDGKRMIFGGFKTMFEYGER
ncbi:MAG: DUF1428 family protein [Polyangiaceae bacterium]